MWRNNMDEADADGEWSDEDYVKDSLRNEKGPDSAHQSSLNRLKVPLSSQPFSSITDPVSLVLNKIDMELGNITDQDSKITSISNLLERSYINSQRPLSVQEKLTPFGKQSTGTGDRDLKGNQDIPNDLDPFTAQEIDMKFKEIMRKKKVSTEPSSQPEKTKNASSSRLFSWNSNRPSATMLSTGYGTDNDSVKTEDFESKFMGMLIPPASNDTNITEKRDRAEREMLDRLMAISETTNLGLEPKPKSIINRPRSLSPQRMRNKNLH